MGFLMMPEEEQHTLPQKATVATETVCHRAMTAPLESYYRAEYQGRMIYFCTEFCLDAFRADPDRFYAAHSRRKTPAKT
jgi:YHS domain-containing protein